MTHRLTEGGSDLARDKPRTVGMRVTEQEYRLIGAAAKVENVPVAVLLHRVLLPEVRRILSATAAES